MSDVGQPTRRPMFPLGIVLLPDAVLPLHVFEQRYRKMVLDCLLTEDQEFGVVLIERGSEIGGGDVRSMAGVMARIVQAAEVGGGRYALITVGTSRFRVTEWLPDDPYPCAMVEPWPDELDDDPKAMAALLAAITEAEVRVRRVNAMASEFGSTSDASAPLGDEPILASYRLCTLAPVGPADQHRLLLAAGPRERVAMLADALDDIEAVLTFQLQSDEDESSPFD